MTVFEVAACPVALAAVLSYLNYTLLKLPSAIGLMALSLAGSLLLVFVGLAVPGVEREARELVRRIDLNQTFLNGMLGFMLFAGSRLIKLHELASRKWAVVALSTVGVNDAPSGGWPLLARSVRGESPFRHIACTRVSRGMPGRRPKVPSPPAAGPPLESRRRTS